MGFPQGFFPLLLVLLDILWRTKKLITKTGVSKCRNYRKIPKISPGAYSFQRPFLRGLYLEGLILGGAYLRREIYVSKSIGPACKGKEIYHFCFVFLCIRGKIPSTSPPGGLYSEGRFNGGFFALRFWGAYIWRGLYMEGLIFGILRYFLARNLSRRSSNV